MPSPQVVIVGAGPTGLLLAGELERRGVSCLLADAHDAPLGWDRATLVHARSLEILEALGLVDQLLPQGVKIRAARLHSGGEVLGMLDLESTGSRYGFDLGVSEEVTESVLRANLERHGGAVVRSTRVVGMRPADDRVIVTLERGGERTDVATSWVVGCDGFHSGVRTLAGVDFPGTDIEPGWAVFDATLTPWEEEFDVTAVYLDATPLILSPLPHRRWRIYARPASDDTDVVADAAAALRLYKPDLEIAGVENPARFVTHARIASTFRAGRVLLAGDAAHTVSPTEGHGMNTGLQDAFNLGWKLALVCQGAAGSALIDSYEAERRPVAERVAESGARVEAGDALADERDRAERDAAIRRIYSDPDSAHHEAVAAAEIDRSYADSPIVLGDATRGLRPGERVPDGLPVHPAFGAARFLHELTHRPEHTLLVLGGPGAEPGAVRELASTLEAEHASSPILGAVIGLSMKPASGIGTVDEAAADRLGIDGVTLLAVRPDRYVGFRHDGRDPAALGAYLEGLGGGRIGEASARRT